MPDAYRPDLLKMSQGLADCSCEFGYGGRRWVLVACLISGSKRKSQGRRWQHWPLRRIEERIQSHRRPCLVGGNYL